MKTTYTYQPTGLEIVTRQDTLTIKAGVKVRLSKSPCGGRGLPKQFKWIEDLNGNFLGMTLANCLIKN